MAITPVEIIALLVAVFIILKVVVFSVSKNKFIKFYDEMFTNDVCMSIYIVLAGVVLFFLLRELTIVQIVASFAFFAFIGAIGIMMHRKEAETFVKKAIKKKITGIGFLLMMTMVIIAGWVVYDVLFSLGWI